ncbi:MAG: hypothetical protein HND58_05475 [Planctomycetota bacterium]|nr:MAG: hypothetical protein HND58_05475 [Planctomycetota bacterium]
MRPTTMALASQRRPGAEGDARDQRDRADDQVHRVGLELRVFGQRGEPDDGEEEGGNPDQTNARGGRVDGAEGWRVAPPAAFDHLAALGVAQPVELRVRATV